MTTDAVARRGADAPTTTDYLSDAPDDLRLNGFLLRLPALGPIVGWTRIEEGQLRARVWIQLDDTGSDLPIAMLTVRCGGREAEPGTAKLWQVFRVESEDADGRDDARLLWSCRSRFRIRRPGRRLLGTWRSPDTDDSPRQQQRDKQSARRQGRGRQGDAAGSGRSLFRACRSGRWRSQIGTASIGSRRLLQAAPMADIRSTTFG